MEELNYFLFILLVFVCMLIFAYEFRKKDYLFRYPLLASLAILGWAGLQIYGLIYNNEYPEILWKTILFITICTVAIFVGYYSNKKTVKHFNWEIDFKKLIFFNFIIFLVGAYFYHKVSLMAEEATLLFGGQWEGIITVYVFFAKLLSISLGVALVIDLYKKSFLNWFVIIASSYFFLERIILAGRREDTFEFIMFFLLWLWWKKGFIINRILFISLSFIGVVFINLVGVYRSLEVFSENKFSAFSEKLNLAFSINWFSLFKDYLTNPTTEILNATLIIDSSEKYPFFDFGLSIWNMFVHFYIPATFLGRDFKEGLKFNFPDTAYLVYGHTPVVGTTFTGFADAFQSFWWFGFIKFFLIGYIMSRWYKSAINRNNIIAKTVLLQLYPVSLLAITHTTHHFFLSFVKIFIFLIIPLYLCKKRKHNAK